MKNNESIPVIPIVTERSVIPVIETKNIDNKIDTALKETNKKLKRKYWKKRFKEDKKLFSKIYCLLGYIETFF